MVKRLLFLISQWLCWSVWSAEGLWFQTRYNSYLARDTPSASPWLLEPVPPTPAPACYDLSLSHSLAPAAKHLLSVQRCGSDTCPQRCTVHLTGAKQACVCAFPVLICRLCECEWNTGGGGQRNWRRMLGYSTGHRVWACEPTAQCTGMSGTPLEASHREGILLDVTMNRKPSPPPEPTQAFEVGGSHRAIAAPGGT